MKRSEYLKNVEKNTIYDMEMRCIVHGTWTKDLMIFIYKAL